MTAMSDYLELKLLDHSLGTASYTMPTSIKVALFDTTASAANLEASTLTGEVSGGAGPYSRKVVAFSAAASGATSNSGQVQWTGMPAVTVRYVAVMDDTANKVLYYGQLGADKVVSAGDSFTIAIGDLDITLA